MKRCDKRRLINSRYTLTANKVELNNLRRLYTFAFSFFYDDDCHIVMRKVRMMIRHKYLVAIKISFLKILSFILAINVLIL